MMIRQDAREYVLGTPGRIQEKAVAVRASFRKNYNTCRLAVADTRDRGHIDRHAKLVA